MSDNPIIDITPAELPAPEPTAEQLLQEQQDKVRIAIATVQNDPIALAELRNYNLDQIQKDFGFDRNTARELKSFAQQQKQLDYEAAAPQGPEHIENLLNTGIAQELERILEDRQELENIVIQSERDGDNITKYKRKGGISLTGPEARERLDYSFNRMLEIRKILGTQRKDDKSGSTNIEINLGNVVTDVLDNIKRER